MRTVQFQLLGSLRATADGVEADLGGHKQRVVLAALLLHPNEVVPIDRLVEWVWSGDPPRTAAHSIHIYVSELRKAFDEVGLTDLILTRDPGYVIRVPPGSIDIEQFEQLLRSADAHLEAGASDDAAGEAEEAIRLWHGEALADFSYDEFAQEDIRLLGDRRLSAETLLARAQLDLGNVERVADRLGRLAAAHPLHEELHRLLMEALYRQGRTADALRVFEQLRRRLADELGVDPSQALFDLEERILLHDPGLRPGFETTATRNPFKGLRPFEESDAPDFFGRSTLVASALSALSEGRRFLALVGPSGAGKSSVTRAGLVPALRAGEVGGSAAWTIAVMTPGSAPFEALRSSLAGVGVAAGPSIEPASVLPLLTDGTLLLVVDQFEELFTLVEDEWVRRGFLDLLAEALTSPKIGFRLIITMRGDFYDRPLMHPAFGDLFAQSVVSIMPLTPAELGEAVAGPSQRVGTAAEPQLVAALVADVAGRSGALPLFQYSLTELFDQRSGNMLTLDDYRSFGGLEGALVGQAERAFAELTVSQQEAVRQIMLRLVQIGLDDATALRRVPASEISSLPLDALDIHEALERFGGLRLLSFDRTPAGTATVEIAHEALLSTWTRLADWIGDNRADLRNRASLRASIDAWVQAGEDPDYLPVGAQLDGLELWYGESDLALTAVEHRFMEAARNQRSVREKEATRAADETRLLARRARVRLIGLVGLALVIVAAAVVGILAASRDRPPKIALVYDGRGDQAWGDLIAAGFDQATREFEIHTEEIVPVAQARTEMVSAAEAGNELIIVGGLLWESALRDTARAYPNVSFVQLDSFVNEPNVRSYLFAHDEGSYLAGVAAARASKSGTVGFVGGVHIPLIEQFRAGFEAGVRATDPDVDTEAIYLSSDFGTGFSRPDLGAQAARELISEGVDVIYAAAGLSSWGVLEAAVQESESRDAHIWFIGADVDQYLQADQRSRPHVLTSMLKRVDIAVHRAIDDFLEGELTGETHVMSLADEGVGLARSGGFLDAYDDDLARAEAALLSGSVSIPDPTGPWRFLDMGGPVRRAALSFDGDDCTFVGPQDLATGERLGVEITNESPDDVVAALVPLLDPDRSLADLRAFRGTAALEEVPDYLDLENASSAIGPPGTHSFTAVLAPGRWVAYCIAPNGNTSIPAAILEVSE